MGTLPTLPTLGSSDWFDWASAVHAQLGTDLGRAGCLTVASSSAPAGTKLLADYVCDGVNDQVQINAALAKASRSGDGFGGQGFGRVLLVGPDFSIADDNATCITMYPNTMLEGNGRATLLRPKWATNVDRGCIELYDADTTHVRVSNLSIGRETAVTFNGHGIKFVQQGSGSSYTIKTGNDPYLQVDNVWVMFAGKKGIWCTGSSGGSRESIIRDCLAWNCVEECIYLDNSSDSQVIGCRASGGSGGYAGIRLGGGNTMVTACKVYYSENPADGFLIDSSRCMISHCSAQDNGRHGFSFTGGDVVASNLIADSNSRLVTNGAGFNIAANGVYDGLEALDRGQTPASPQLTQFAFSGSPTVMLTGRSSLGSGGVNHVTGTPGGNSYVRIVRQGTSVYAVG